MLYVKRVQRQAALNPVARAIAKAKLHQTVLDAKIRLYLFGDNEPCTEFCEGVGTVLAVLGWAVEADPKAKPDPHDLSVLRGGLSALQQMLLTDKWQRINNVAVETALDAALRLITKLSVTQVAEPLGISRKLFVGTEATAWVSGSVKNLDDSTTCFFCA